MNRTYVSLPKHSAEPVYLDCNATSPLEPDVAAAMHAHFMADVGNAGSRTHEHGMRAKRLVENAREQIAGVVACGNDEVIFTSGATEANNIAILGMARHARETGRKHIVTTAMEHKAVLEPIEALEADGFEVSLVAPGRKGFVTADEVLSAMRADTLMVSVMHANNETGVIQPIEEIAGAMSGHPAFLHVDAAQGFGKEIAPLRSKRVDMISVSSHKIYGPAGVGALIARRREHRRLPLRPISFGGGQERGLRPGTLPVSLIVGFGLAAEIALRDHQKREERCEEIRRAALECLGNLRIRLHGDQTHCLPHTINLSIHGIDSEAMMVALKDVASISNGSACTSQSYSPSHVLLAMDLSEEEIAGAVRISWSHLTPDIPWNTIADRMAALI